MIIPVRCFTCNKVLASLYKEYIKLIELNKLKNEEDVISGLDDISIENSNVQIFEKLKVDRYCCRRHLMTHVDLIQKI